MYLVWNQNDFSSVYEAIKAQKFALTSEEPPIMSGELDELFNYNPWKIDLHNTDMIFPDGKNIYASIAEGVFEFVPSTWSAKPLVRLSRCVAQRDATQTLSQWKKMKLEDL